MVLTLFFNVLMPPHICAVCLFYEKCRLCVLSNILTVAFPGGLPVEINNPVPVSQVRFQKFRIINVNKRLALLLEKKFHRQQGNFFYES